MGDATQGDLVHTAFHASWAMQHRWVLLPDEGAPDVDPNAVFMEIASNGVIWMRKSGHIAHFRAQGRRLTQRRRLRDETASNTSPC